MSSCRRVLFCLALLTAMMGAACGDPPDKEMQQAQTAIDAARAAGAEQYSPQEFTAAQDALKRSTDAVAQRDYRLALNLALDARERAQTATKDATERRATARSTASKALTTATDAANLARAALKTAETAHAPARTLTTARRAIADADSRLQKARTALDTGDFAAVSGSAAGITERLQAVQRDLEAFATVSGRRRH